MSQPSSPHISTHILDTSLGLPAAGVPVELKFQLATKDSESEWTLLSKGETNGDGRFVFETELKAGNYQIVFQTEAYFKKHNQEHFFLNTPVLFKIENTKRKYHVPLLLNPFGFSTYRGS